MKPKSGKRIFRPVAVLVTVLALLLVFCLPGMVSAATAGPNNAGTGANVTGVGTVAWTGYGYITTVGTPYATVSLNSGNPGQVSNYLRGTGYGFSIPTNATINGITVTINRQSTGTSSPFIRDNEVKLVKGGVIQATNLAATTDWPTSMGTATYGGTAILWGTTWTPSDINNSEFGVVLSVRNANTNFNRDRTASVDYIRITVTYSLSSPIVTTTTPATNIGATSATTGGNVSSDGGAAITERGVCYSTSINPTTANGKVTAAGTTGSFTSDLAGLSSGTLYHYRAYAINSVGTSYGADQTFTTLSTYSVTYNANGASGTVPTDGNSPYISGATITVLGNTGSLSITGYTFAGWNTAANGSGTSYQATASFAMGSANVTLYAQWTVNSYTISFDSAGGTDVDPITQDFGTDVTAPTAPTKTGYTFAGWLPVVPETMPAYNQTLVAQWTVNSYTISFDSAGGTDVDPITQDFGTDVTAPTAPTKTGYTFAGWLPVVPETMPAYNQTLVAQWTVNSYTISFDSAGGTDVDPITQDFGTDVTAPTAPTKTGYTFAGWLPVVPETMPAYNQTLYAQWTVNSYTISFDSAGGTDVDPITQDFGTDVTAPTAPTKTGYTFAGWLPVVPETMPAYNQTLVAQWTVNSYTISFDSAGGTDVDPITQDFGTDVTAPTAPTKTGYTFAGWLPVVPETMPAYNQTLVAQWTVNSYTISFDSAGGTDVDPITQDFGTDVTAPTAPTKTGYTFAGWLPVVPETMPAYNQTLVAQWTVNSYTISFDSAGGTDVDPITQDFGTDVTAPTAPTKTGYTFAGWLPVVPETMPAYNQTLYAQWTVNSYTISFDSAGGTDVDPITQDFGTDVTAPTAPTKTGYTFAGWLPVVPETMPAYNQTLVAQWTVNSYTISFDSAGGTDVDPITQDFGTDVTAPTAPTKTGYTFAGWLPVVPETMPAYNQTLVAQWTVNSYTISFDSAGGTDVDPITQDFGTDVTAPTAPTKTGYTFAGWLPVVPETMPAYNQTLVAQWTVNSYTISFDSAGGTDVDPITQDFGTDVTAPTAPTKTGYTFAGWLPVVPETMPAYNQTLYAQWTVNSYTISFDSAGGTDVDPITQDFGTDVTAPTAPTKTGYTFAGWLPVVPETMPAYNQTLYAQWTVNSYTISFDSAGGTDVDPITQDFGTDVTAPTAPTKTGYTFAGWLPVVPETMPAYNQTLVAQWTVNSYTISFDSAGGTDVDPITQNFGTDVTAPTAPTKTGYTFAGWLPVVPETMPAYNQTLVAQWTVNSYTISFDSAGGTDVDPITQDFGTDVTAPTAPTKTGYTFAGWLPVVPETMPAYNQTLVAQWTVNSYTISFDSAGGTDVDPITQDFGTDVTAPTAPTKTGYTFAGWLPVVPETMPAYNQTLVAQWTVNSYTISFDSAGGTDVDPITQDFGTDVTAPTAPTKTGYTFAGWLPVVPETMPAYNQTLYAQWTVNSYTISFDSAGGTDVDPITQDFGTDVTAPTAPTKTGYTFAGWLPVVPETMPAYNQTLVAQWTVNSYTISFDSAGGTDVDPITQDFGTDVTAPTAPTKTGYTFAGWLPVVPETMPAYNQTLVAQWTVNSYTISFDSAGGTDVDPITQDFGTDVTAPTAPTKTGYTFAGWLPVVPETMPAYNQTLVAQWTVNSYTISFDSAGGTDVDPITQDFGTDVTAPTAPTKTGYTFAGWLPVVPETMPAYNQTLVAQWTVNSYTISFDSAGGTDVDPITQDFGTDVTAPTAPTKTGYTFAGWLPVVPETMPAYNQTLVAQWTVNSYTISFDSAGGTDVDPITQDFGTDVTAPTAPTKTGYTFAGWLPVVPETMPAYNQTLYAQWTVNSYTISFDSAGGTDVDPITQDFGTDVTAPTAPTKTGYTFAGWLPVVPETMPAYNQTLVAQWTVNSYTISFDSAGGTDVDPITQDFGTDVTAPTAPTKTGYTFAGWLPVVPETMPAYNQTLVAQWTVNSYTISFDSAGGTDVDPITQDFGTDVTAPTAPTKTGYTFAGWLPVVPETMPAYNQTLYAQWTVNSYTISFDSAGGTDVDPITQDFGTDVTAPTAPTKTGYTFAGWLPVVPETMPAYNQTLVAQWTVNSYTISFDSAGGTDVDPITQDFGTDVTAPTAPTKTGYTFAGWLPVVPETMPAYNQTLVAQWTVNSYTISFDSAGGTDVDPITQDFGTDVTAPTAPTKTGYTFAGWLPVVPETMPAYNQTLVAQWTVNSYTISFDSAGGTDVDPITQDFGTDVTAPTAPTKTGYTFAGWLPVVPETMPAYNQTLVAQWTVNSYTISFDSAGGTDVDPITQDFGTDVTAPTAPTKTGYTFAGWLPVVPETMPAYNQTLVAQWTVNSYTISFDSAGGTDVDPITQDFGTDVTAPTAPTKTGYTFAGWLPVVPETMPAYNQTLVAQWTVNSYTISFDSAGGTDVDPITQDFGTDVTAPTAPTKTGYTFAGWLPVVPETMPAYNQTLVAQWTVNSYTISFDSAGGTDVDPITQDFGTDVTAPTAPTKTGYTFAGWLPVVPETMPAYNQTLVAQWTVNSYTISFDENGGSYVADITQDYGTVVSAPSNPNRAGFSFAGWYSNSALTSAYTFTTMPAKDIMLYAKWTIDNSTYTLTVSDVTFTTINFGDAQPAAKSMTITSTGNSAATISSVTASNSDFTIGGSGSTVPAGGSITSWTVRPVAGLSVGTHNATITVTYNGGAAATATVNIVINSTSSNLTLSVNPGSLQYSDRVQLKATYSGPGLKFLRTIDFKIGTTTVGSSVTDRNGVATLNYDIQQVPGNYTVTAKVRNMSYSDTKSLTITKEDASISYTGQTSANASRGASTANVSLTAQVKDLAGDSRSGSYLGLPAQIVIKKSGVQVGSTQSAMCTSDGRLSFSSVRLAKGTYTVTVSSAGDDRYNALTSSTATIIVR